MLSGNRFAGSLPKRSRNRTGSEQLPQIAWISAKGNWRRWENERNRVAQKWRRLPPIARRAQQSVALRWLDQPAGRSEYRKARVRDRLAPPVKGQRSPVRQVTKAK